MGYREELTMLMSDFSWITNAKGGLCHPGPNSPKSLGECAEAEEESIVYNKAGDPPCLAFIGNSHMGHHIRTIASLAKEYDVSFLWLARHSWGDLFGGCGSTPDPPSPWDEQRIRILKQWKPKRVIFSNNRPKCLLANNSTLDALMSGS